LILTNYHVVKGGPVFGQPQPEDAEVRLYVRFADRSGCDAQIFAADPRSDLAVLKLLTDSGGVRPSDLRPMPLGDGGSVRKGQVVLALGNPYAMARDGSASAAWGMISNTGRRAAQPEGLPFDSEARKQLTVHHFGTLLQVSMPLDLGTSGGPLLNLRGELIGITTSLAALDGYEKSVGHAVPLDEGTRRVIDTLSRGYEVEYGLLGVTPETVLRQFVPGMDQASAAQASEVRPGSPAATAGLRDHDAILAVDSVPTYSKDDLMREVGNRPPGSTITLRVCSPYRTGGRARDLEVTLGKWPPLNDGEIVAAQERPERVWRGLVVDYGTARIQFTPRQEQFDVVLVRKVSPANRTFAASSTSERVELQPGDFITHVDGQPVHTPEEFASAVQDLTGDVRLSLLGRPDVLVRP
jgi:serine protease Do